MNFRTKIGNNLGVEVIVVSPFEQNCRILWNKDTKNAVVIDPGAELDRIYAAIDKLGVTVKAIWLTHGHIDHVGGAMQLAREKDVKILGPNIEDKFITEQICQHRDRLKVDYPIYAAFTDIENCTADQWLNDRDKLYLDDLCFDVYHWAGHSPGHVVFYNKENDLLIAGDVVFKHSVGRTDLTGSNQALLEKNIRENLLPMSDSTIILCGHGEDFTLGEVRRTNPFLVRWARANR